MVAKNVIVQLPRYLTWQSAFMGCLRGYTESACTDNSAAKAYFPVGVTTAKLTPALPGIPRPLPFAPIDGHQVVVDRVVVIAIPPTSSTTQAVRLTDASGNSRGLLDSN